MDADEVARYQLPALADLFLVENRTVDLADIGQHELFAAGQALLIQGSAGPHMPAAIFLYQKLVPRWITNPTRPDTMMNLAPALQWSVPDAAPASEAALLLASFAAFYEELASIKRGQHEGVLARYLAPDETAVPLSDAELAARAGARLLQQLREQHLAFQRKASVQQIKMHHTALYVMAALADEILLLELNWPGAEHWLPVLLERQLFSTSHSGVVFFELADKLIRSAGSDPLHADLASNSVFLLALRLGFKGQYRTAAGELRLNHYRQQLAAHRQHRPAAPCAAGGGGAGILPAGLPAQYRGWQGRAAGAAVGLAPGAQAGGHRLPAAVQRDLGRPRLSTRPTLQALSYAATPRFQWRSADRAGGGHPDLARPEAGQAAHAVVGRAGQTGAGFGGAARPRRTAALSGPRSARRITRARGCW
jgi:type VI secretion system protein ImpK